MFRTSNWHLLRNVAMAASLLLLSAVPSAGTNVEVVVSTIGPTSDVGIAGRSVSNMRNFSISADGSWWTASFALDGNVDGVHLRGQGTSSPDVIAQDGVTAIPSLTGLVDMGSAVLTQVPSVNNNGIVSGYFENRASGEPDGFIYHYDGSSLSIIARDTDAIGPFPGNTYSKSLHSPNTLANGQVAYIADNTAGTLVDTEDEFSLTSNGSAFAGQQEGVTPYAGALLQNIDSFDYQVSADGNTFLFTGDTDATDTGVDDIVVYGIVGTAGTVVLQEGVTEVAPGVTYDDSYDSFLAPNGDWYAGGDTSSSGVHVTLRNGQVLDMTGDPAPNGFLYDRFQAGAIAGDSAGNYVSLWTTTATTATDEILVYNGKHVLLTEGEIVDIDFGNGPESARINNFWDGALAISDDGWVYTMAVLGDPQTGQNMGQAFFRLRAVPEPGSIALVAGGLVVVLGSSLRRRFAAAK